MSSRDQCDYLICTVTQFELVTVWLRSNSMRNVCLSSVFSWIWAPGEINNIPHEIGCLCLNIKKHFLQVASVLTLCLRCFFFNWIHFSVWDYLLGCISKSSHLMVLCSLCLFFHCLLLSSTFLIFLSCQIPNSLWHILLTDGIRLET